MTSYRIINRISGLELGCYIATSEQGALDAMARDAGYASHAGARGPCLELPLRRGKENYRKSTGQKVDTL